MRRLADTTEQAPDSVLTYYGDKITSGKVEDINNRIKAIKRQAYENIPNGTGFSTYFG